ncbi:hypothetical protein NC651_016455 [Populus alba x Populus x berolinensis]|nr:hypothetical protein NC651_016455 [Populus alba x Populus x berolinensis]
MSVSQNWVSGVSVERKNKRKEGSKKRKQKNGVWRRAGLGWVVLGCDCDDDREGERERRKGRWRIARQWLLASNNVSFAKKSVLFQELGARKSEVQGDAVVSNRGNALRVHCNKGIQVVASSDKITEK